MSLISCVYLFVCCVYFRFDFTKKRFDPLDNHAIIQMFVCITPNDSKQTKRVLNVQCDHVQNNPKRSKTKQSVTCLNTMPDTHTRSTGSMYLGSQIFNCTCAWNTVIWLHDCKSSTSIRKLNVRAATDADSKKTDRSRTEIAVLLFYQNQSQIFSDGGT